MHAVFAACVVVPVGVVVVFVLVPAIGMAVAMRMREVPLAEPRLVADDFTRRSFRHDPLVLSENIEPVGKLADEVKVVRRGDDGLSLFALRYHDVH